jgi:hypothetical protein
VLIDSTDKMMSMPHFPTLDELRPHLDIPEMNTGRQFSLTTPSGFITDDLETLHAVTYEDGRIRLSSGIECAFYLFRGQPEEYSPCLPTLGRLKHLEDRLLALCRNVAFEEAISEHPFVRLSEQTSFLNHPLFIDKQGLVQHYGLATDILDLTSNFDVASFFATCQWDAASRSYLPVVSAKGPGVMYRISSAFWGCDNMPAELGTIGWQPLKRPEQQRAHGLRMKPGQDFCTLPHVQMIKFRQCPDISNRIWKSFDEGKVLFPNDAAADLAMQAEALTEFTRHQLDEAWGRLDEWDGVSRDTEKRHEVEQNIGLTIAVSTILTWDGLDVERDEAKLADQLLEILSNVHFRRVANPLT